MNHKKRLAYYRAKSTEGKYLVARPGWSDIGRRSQAAFYTRQTSALMWRYNTTSSQVLSAYFYRYKSVPETEQWNHDKRKAKRVMRVYGKSCEVFHSTCPVCVAWGMLRMYRKYPLLKRVYAHIMWAGDGDEIQF